MENSISKVMLWQRNNKRGIIIAYKNYALVASQIILEIKSCSNGEIDLGELISRMKVKLSTMIAGDIPWFVLQVKQDLEVRGIIKTSLNYDRIQIIKLKKKYFDFKFIKSLEDRD